MALNDTKIRNTKPSNKPIKLFDGGGEVVAREWFGKFSANWAPNHSIKIKNRLEKDVFPYIGHRPINDIKAPELLMVLRRIESRGALDTAHRARTNCSQIFKYAVATGGVDGTRLLRGALPAAKEGLT